MGLIQPMMSRMSIIIGVLLVWGPEQRDLFEGKGTKKT